jgi:hypothetical protein
MSSTEVEESPSTSSKMVEKHVNLDAEPIAGVESAGEVIPNAPITPTVPAADVPEPSESVTADPPTVRARSPTPTSTPVRKPASPSAAPAPPP